MPPRTTTRRLKNGTRVVMAAANDNLQEWECQAEAVRQVKLIPGYGDDAGPDVTFTFAADFNAARRSVRESVKAKATGIKAGEEDLRFYGRGGRVLLIELKGPTTPISADQRKRHALHRHLGFQVEIVRFKTMEQGVDDVLRIVRDWIGGATELSLP
jgi:hypothetical protein